MIIVIIQNYSQINIRNSKQTHLIICQQSKEEKKKSNKTKQTIINKSLGYVMYSSCDTLLDSMGYRLY